MAILSRSRLMPFAHAFNGSKFLGHVRRFRQHPIRAYGVAFGLVAVATLVRLALHQELSTTAPFTTYSLAVIIVALTGGFWPAVVALTLSTALGSILFLPPAFSLTLAQGAEWTMLMFFLFTGIIVILISSLMTCIFAHDEHQQFLFGELQHRSRNLFAVVQGIASRTLVESRTLSEAKTGIESRLSALARTYARVADNEWVGAPLDQIVSEELISFTEQVSSTGCNVIVSTPAAQNFALIIHELATNAAKYGALSCSEGKVAIEGRTDFDSRGERFCFAWSESGGPAVKPPQRKGFGNSILIGLAKHFAQEVKANYRPEGLIYELWFSLSSIQASSRR